ncbi:hypothetical protein RHDC4_01621 [Rhodocyclaceae bacterium]|nr:hypothetical protein RHDC4_01621 [Rhodocyclaceae bacterium]
MAYRFHDDGTLPSNGEVFVFGSNLAGRHGKGAAVIAKQRFGANYGVSAGYMFGGTPGAHCYAVPTKDANIRTLPLDEIEYHVSQFRKAAAESDLFGLTFFVTRIGCGLAGYKDADIAPMFAGFPDNCSFPKEWERYLNF